MRAKKKKEARLMKAQRIEALETLVVFLLTRSDAAICGGPDNTDTKSGSVRARRSSLSTRNAPREKIY